MLLEVHRRLLDRDEYRGARRPHSERSRTGLAAAVTTLPQLHSYRRRRRYVATLIGRPVRVLQRRLTSGPGPGGNCPRAIRDDPSFCGRQRPGWARTGPPGLAATRLWPTRPSSCVTCPRRAVDGLRQRPYRDPLRRRARIGRSPCRDQPMGRLLFLRVRAGRGARRPI